MNMMTSLQVHQLRNLQSADLRLVDCNILTGANGSGKTSLLEAVFLLSRGRTFRHHEPKRYISLGESSCTVWARLGDEQTLAVQKQIDGVGASSAILKLNGETVAGISVLSAKLPVLLIDPAGMSVLEEGSGLRRQMLDWLAFHVKPDFYTHWLAYQKILKQRNALLKSPLSASYQNQMSAWDWQIKDHAVYLHESRLAVFEQWQVCFEQVVAELLPKYQGDVSLQYQAGFDVKEGLFAILQDRLMKDRELGYTRIGSHRADVSVMLKSLQGGYRLREQAVHILSRGEKKLLIMALKLSQLQVMCQHMAQNHVQASPVVLIDDIDAELDEQAMNLLISRLAKLPCQLIISTLNQSVAKQVVESIKQISSEQGVVKSCKVFHVEQGIIQSVSDE